LKSRVEGFGSQAVLAGYLKLEDESDETVLSNLLLDAVSQRYALIILAGETAIMDQNDLVPRAVERAGGSVECVGVPVDPGNLLMLAYLGNVPVVGAPGCARSLKTNALDWILPRLLAGERLSRIDLVKMGQGGLLEDTAMRPMPRDRLG
jgi:molybdenum cofactor cytidylyltransferase